MGDNPIVTIIGANGAGKSTLLKAISGILPTKEGVIGYRGADISKFSPVKIVGLGISQVPRVDNFLPIRQCRIISTWGLFIP